MNEDKNIHEDSLAASDIRIRNFLVKGCSRITVFVYLIIALMLVLAIIIGIVQAFQALFVAGITDASSGMINSLTLYNAINAILLIIVLATLIDLVRSYVKYGRVLVTPILVAGITTTVRHLLISEMELPDYIGVSIIILVLTVAIVFIGREDRRVAMHAQGKIVEEFTLPSLRKKNDKTDSNEPEK